MDAALEHLIYLLIFTVTGLAYINLQFRRLNKKIRFQIRKRWTR